MDLSVGDEFDISVDRLGVSGEGVGQVDGYTVFVLGALPKERVRAKLVERRRRFGRAEVLEFLSRSPKRVESVCPLFGKCGGCQLMHLEYGEQLLAKRQRVVDALERIGKFSGVEVAACTESPSPLHYRNKIQLPVCSGKEMRLGLYARGTHDVVEIERCFIHCELGERAFQVVVDLLKGAQWEPGVLRHVLIKTAVNTNQVLVVLVTRESKVAGLTELANQMMAALDKIKGVVHHVNPRSDNVVLSGEFVTLVGEGAIEERLDGFVFKVSPASFFQVNTAQAERLYRRAVELAGLTGSEVVLDAYCGVGTLSLFFARKAKEVIGVECVLEAIADAKENAKKNGVVNVSFFCAKAEVFLEQMKAVDVALLNPPRKGCDPAVLEALIALKPKGIVYISCDPATLARDVALLCEGGYSLDCVEPFDMFPQTAHVETLVCLKTVN